MQRIAYRYGADWQQGTFVNSTLDYAQYVSPYGHVALVPKRAVSTWVTETGAQAVGGTQPAGGGMPSISASNTQGHGAAAWSALSVYGLTSQAGDALSFSTTALEVTLHLAGYVAAGVGVLSGQGVVADNIRNGATASVSVDGTVLATLDCYNARPALTLYLDGSSHTIQVTHTGGYNPAVQPSLLGAVVSGTGTSVATQLTPTLLFHPVTIQATWRVTAASANTYTLEKKQSGGSFTMLYGPGGSQSTTPLNAGTHYSGSTYVPGVDLYVGTGTSLTTNDSATFTTDVLMVAVESIAYGTGTGSGASTYTTPVLDLGDPAAQLVVAEWKQSTAVLAVSASSGNTRTPDASWATVPSCMLGGCTTSDGTQYGTAGLMAAPPGRYATLTVTLAGVGTVAPWLQDLMLYAKVPGRDPLDLRLPQGTGVVMGAQQAAWLDALESIACCDLGAEKDLLRSAISIGGAFDQYLAGYLADLGLQQVTGEQPATAQARARGVLSSAAGALSLTGIATQVALLVTGAAGPVTVTGTAGSLVATCNGVQVTQGASQSYTVTIPPAPYLGMPGLPIGSSTTAGSAQQIIYQHVTTTLRPVGGAASVVFT